MNGNCYILKKQIEGMMINSIDTPKETILEQMNEPRPLPLGRVDFDEWSDRIISGACIPGGEEDPVAFKEGQKSALAHMIMHLKPTESHVADAYFIHSLRKAAANQVAFAVAEDLRSKAKERLSAKEALERSEVKDAQHLMAELECSTISIP